MSKATLKPTDGKSWQKTKSENTRTTILDAAIECFYDLGYNNTTTEKIARKAGVSRGAMLHHFPSRKALIKATVIHLAQKRFDLFESQSAKIHDGEEFSLIGEGIDAYWEQLHSPLFIVFHELQVASRTDSELRSVMIPAMKKLDESWRKASIRIFPDLAQSEAFDTANLLTAYFLEGMAVSNAVRGPVPKTMLTWLKDQLADMFKDVRTVKRNPVSKSSRKKK